MSFNSVTLRTTTTQKKYEKFLENSYDGSCIFCSKDALVVEYKYWILVKNKFPYDRVFSKHFLLATKRHTFEPIDLTQEEREEYQHLLDTLDFNQCTLNKKSDRSIPQHLHFHLLSF